MHILGVDSSLTGNGICCLSPSNDGPDQVELFHFGETKLREAKRLIALRRKLRDILEFFSPDIAVIEGYSFDSTNRLADMAEWGGVIRAELGDRDIPYIVITPKRLKKFCAGNGDANKKMMVDSVLEHYGVNTYENDDEADATALAYLGKVFLSGDSQRRCELEVVRDLKNELRGIKKEYAKFKILRGVL